MLEKGIFSAAVIHSLYAITVHLQAAMISYGNMTYCFGKTVTPEGVAEF